MNRRPWAPAFFTIWTGQAFSLVGSTTVQFAIIWWITAKTDSASVLTIATLAATFPQALAGPFAGVLVDRWNRKAVMIGADLLTAVSSLGLAALYLYGEPLLWHVYAVLAIRSVCAAFHWPAMAASMPLIVPAEHLTLTAGLNQGLQSAATLAGPALGAVLLAVWPMSSLIMLDVVGAVVASLALLAVRIPQPPEETRGAGRGSFFAEMVAGFRVLAGTRGLLLLTLASALMVFIFLPIGAFFPLMVNRHFGGGAWHLGIVQIAYGAGMLIGAAVLGVWGGTRRKVITINAASVAEGAMIVAMGLLPSHLFALFAAASFVLGAAGPFFHGPFTALIQSRIEPGMLGRVFSFISTLMLLATPLGLLGAGPAAEAVGLPVWFAVAGTAIALIGVACFFVPAIMRLEETGAGAGVAG